MVSSVMSGNATTLNGVISTLGPSGTDSAYEAGKHCSQVLLFPSFAAAVEHALETNGYALVPAGYLEFQDGKLADSWVDMHFRLLGRMRIVDVWESPTKTMCLAINRNRVADRRSVRSIALHPATAAFARRACAGVDITFVNSKPLAVEVATSGRVDACIGSVDVVAESPLEPVEYFHPTMVWTLYQAVQDSPADALPADTASAPSQR
ncbi:hypothetical protein QTQ03_09075 [Micromonospora sp. WMMA1363]|uniref:hypothetical protein n=1 Tax=Micromonospora sp. WMMA1363 TaxID=3053985 RepID=UPI00259C9C41|nr:hypothetical protein [Micromonospora sp. WMMA1363]MDM4719721.1 hypothetical protein [Micromonospora sp. WMMA1363]